MTKATILLFAHLKDKAGTNRVSMEFPDGTTIGEMKTLLVEKIPSLRAQLNKVLVSVDQKIVLDEDIFPDDAEIAIFPPVSGGARAEKPTILLIVDEPLDQNALVSRLTHDEVGAACTFTGIVRHSTGGETPYLTDAIEYEAYQPMAEKQMGIIAAEIRERWRDVDGIGIVQRIGHLEAGTPSVLITCTSSHRNAGVFEAARYGIDRLKEIVPVWKKEKNKNQERWITGEYSMQPGDS